MDEIMRQQQEIEHLQKKLQSVTKAYQQVVQELNQIKQRPKTKGRPALAQEKKAKILSLYRQGRTMRMIVEQEQVSLGTVHRVIKETAEKSRIVYVFADREIPATIIDANNYMEKVQIWNLTDQLISRAFGVKENPTWEDYEGFLESRCMPRRRYGIREELRLMGIDSYDPYQILEKTSGRLYEDHQYLVRMQKDWIREFDTIIKSTQDEKKRRKQLMNLMHSSEKEWKRNEVEY